MSVQKHTVWPPECLRELLTHGAYTSLTHFEQYLGPANSTRIILPFLHLVLLRLWDALWALEALDRCAILDKILSLCLSFVHRRNNVSAYLIMLLGGLHMLIMQSSLNNAWNIVDILFT